MAIVETGRQLSYQHRHRAELRHARLLFIIAYPLCLVFATSRRLAMAAAAPGTRSVFAEAKAMAGSVIPFAFR
jgi:hypothetical protein